MKRVILTGGSGFLGKQVLQLLVEAGMEVIAIEHNTPLPVTATFQIKQGGTASITTKYIDDFKPDAILHCARPTFGRFKKWGRKIAAYKANRINQTLLNQIGQAKHKPKLIFASGSLMYGNSNEPKDETAPLTPISYARQYHYGEEPILRAATNSSGITVLLLRFPWILGNGSWFKWFYLDNMLKHGAIPKIGSGENQMTMLSLMDAANLMIRYGAEINKSGIFNIFGNQVHTQNEFTETVCKVFGVLSTPYTNLYGKALEREAIEAFESNILLATKENSILEKYTIETVPETLEKIKEQLK